MKPRQDDRHFADDIFKCIVLNEDIWISIKISMKFVPRGQINNIPALVQIRPGDKPLSEPMVVSLLEHVCVIRPQWVNTKYNVIWWLVYTWLSVELIRCFIGKCPTADDCLVEMTRLKWNILPRPWQACYRWKQWETTEFPYINMVDVVESY